MANSIVYLVWGLLVSVAISCGNQSSKNDTAPQDPAPEAEPEPGPELTEPANKTPKEQNTQPKQPETPKTEKEPEAPVGEGAAAKPDLSKIVGVWSSDCQNDGENSSSERGNVDFLEDGSVKLIVQVFNALDCKADELESTFKLNGRYSGGALIEGQGQVRSIEYLVETITLAMHGATVKTANKRRFCQLQGWEDSVSKEVTGLKCRRLDLDNPKAGTTIFDIFLVDDAGLKIGLDRNRSESEQNGSSIEKRPSALAPAIYLRQP